MTDHTSNWNNQLADSGPSEPLELELDIEKYIFEMAEFDMTDEQKIELLQTLWSIMRSFVELGFTVDVCGQSMDDDNLIAVPSANDLYPCSQTGELYPNKNNKELAP